MKIGFMCGMARNGICTVDELLGEIHAAEVLGFDQAWMAQVFSTDAVMLMGLAGRETRTIRLGTAVTPSHPRHPTALAIQALTAAAMSGGRFDLGLGVSHQVVIEDMYGISYAKPATHMREYLEVLMPLLRGEACDFEGERYRVHARMNVPDAKPVPVLIAALEPKMLAIAGRLADGTSTWMTGPRTLETHTIPGIRNAAEMAGKPAPRIVAGFPIILTEDVDATRVRLAKKMELYGHIPSYRGMLEREGAEHPSDLAMLGDERALRAQLHRLADIGVTDFNAFCMPVDDGAIERTMAFLAEERGALGADGGSA